jgi:hypothetical protein
VLTDTLKELGFKDLSYLMNPGIYVLCLNGEVVYVGQTINIFGRLGASPDHRVRPYDKIYFIKCNLNELDRLEALMILRLKPSEGNAYNFNNNTDPGHRPVPSEPGQSTHTITVGGVALSLKGRRRI